MDASTAVNPGQPGVIQGLFAAAAGGALPDLESLAARVELRAHDRGSTVFSQDQAHPFVYAVSTGLIKLVYLDEKGNEWIKAFVPEGHFFASIGALAPGGRSTFMAIALEPARLERVAIADIAALTGRHLAWSRAMTALAMQYAARKEQRERELLTLSAEERFVEFERQFPQLLERVPQKDLARHLGVTPVGLNRIISRVHNRARPGW